MEFYIRPDDTNGEWTHDYSYEVFLPKSFFGETFTFLGKKALAKDFSNTFLRRPSAPFYLKDMQWTDNYSDFQFKAHEYLDRYELSFSEAILKYSKEAVSIAPHNENYEIEFEGNKILIFGNFSPEEEYAVTVGDIQDRFGRSLHFNTFNLPPSYINKDETRLLRTQKAKTFFYTRENLPEFVVKRGGEEERKMVDITICRINLEGNSVFKETDMVFKDVDKEDQYRYGRMEQVKEEVKKKFKFKDELTSNDCTEKKTIPVQFEESRIVKIETSAWIKAFSQPHGIFSIFMEDEKNLNYTARYFGITNTALFLKKGKQKVFVWGTDLDDSRPLRNLPVYLKNINWSFRGDNLPKNPSYLFDIMSANHLGATDENGAVIANWPDNVSSNNLAAIVSTDDRFGVVFSEWNQGINSRNFPLNNITEDDRFFGKRDILGHIYTEKLLYRPNQKVHWKAIFRERDKEDATLSFPGFTEVQIKIENAKNELLVDKKERLTDWGSVAGEIIIPSNVPLGRLSISATPILDGELVSKAGVYVPLKIEEYSLPKFKISVDSEKHDYFSNEEISLQVKATEFTGNPIVGGSVKYRLLARPFYPTDTEDTGFIYSTEKGRFARSYRTQTILSSEQEISPDGLSVLRIPLKEGFTEDTAHSLSLELTVVDDQGREIGETLSFRRFQALNENDHILGLKLPKKFISLKDALEFEFVSKNYQLNRIPNRPLRLRISEKVQKCQKEEAFLKGEINRCEVVENEIISENLKTDENGGGFFSHDFENPGKYILELSNGDKKVSQTIWVTWKDIPPAVDRKDDRYLDFTLDKESYEQGDTAKLFIHAPYPKSTVLLSFEANDVIEYETIELETSALEYDISVKNKFIPNIYVSAIVVEKTNDNRIPDFKIGYVNLTSDVHSKTLNIELETEKEVYRPGEEVQLQIKTTNQEGEGVEAEVSIAAVDEAIIRLGGQVDTRFLRSFYSKRLLFVDNAFSLVGLHHDRYFATYGGAGKGGLSYDVPDVRKNFEEVAHYDAFVKTDTNGSASVSFLVPDKLTSYIILGAGGSQYKHLFGSSEQMISVQKDFFVEPIIPRFLRKNDELTINARVYNRTEEKAEVGVLFEFEGAELLDDNAEKRKTIPSKSTGDFEYRIKVSDNAKKAQLTFKTVSNTGTDAIELSLPILGYDLFSEVVDSGLITKDQDNLKLVLPEYISREKGILELEVSTSVITALKGNLAKLVRYPYGCAEQTISSTVPNAIYYNLQKLLEEEDETAKAYTLAGIERLKKFQTPDGGFALWQGAENSSSYVSATIGEGLVLIEDSGFDLPSEMKEQYLDYLTKKLQSKINSGNYQSGRLSESEKLKFAFIAAKLGNDMSFLKFVDMSFYKLPVLSPKDKARLAEIYLFALKQDSKTKKELIKRKLEIISENLWQSIESKKIDEETLFVVENSSGYGRFSNRVSDLAEIFTVLVKLDDKNPLITALLEQIQNPSSKNTYFSSYTERTRFLALKSYFDQTREEKKTALNIVLKIGEKEFPLEVDSFNTETLTLDLLEVLEKEKNEIEISAFLKNDESFYINYKSTYYVDDISKMQPTENKLKVWRNVKYGNGEKVKDFSKAKVGDIYWVDLHIENPERKNQIVVSDHLPSNFEFIDTPEYADGFERLEFRDDRLDVFLKEGVQQVFIGYKVRVISEGAFHWPPAKGVAMYEPGISGSGQGRMVHIDSE